MKQYVEIKDEVAAWSRLNFGDQNTKALRVYTPGGTPAAGFSVGLGGLAPLLGIVEEFGELHEALIRDDPEEVKDAIGDIGIYLCDYLSREGLRWPLVDSGGALMTNSAMGYFIATLGRLYHAHLKHYQSIRGMEDKNTYNATRAAIVGELVGYLDSVADECVAGGLLVAMNEAWENVVKKRDWKTNPSKGAPVQGDTSLEVFSKEGGGSGL